ncbi:MAG TPA: ABC transporter ATP-binding protein [Steroidobacteraceae bacterium]|jgi:ABC-2 type transport system ATP-binding protein|nr:ABC transporter ATP-binding protein [Steroidobacteraceae bacterium]
MIKIDNLTRRYGGFAAVDDVSFRIERGEVVGLLGHNGAGKTTIMRMLTGFLEPTNGSIRIDNLTMGPDTAAIQRRIGYLPENCPTWPEMSVLEFLEYQAMLHDVPEARRAAAIIAAIRRTALTDRVTQSISTLSRGYRQRVGVAQAILHSPDIIILDEPTNGLDPTQILHMRELIRDLAKSATVIVSTHILQEVQAVCQRVLILRAGRKVVDARLAELQQDARLVVTLDAEEARARPALSAVPGVSAVKLQATLSVPAGTHYQYALAADEAATPQVARAVNAAGFGLYGLLREQRTLEAVFADVNAGLAVAGAGSEVARAA